jgi:putative ABC transport system permease protein
LNNASYTIIGVMPAQFAFPLAYRAALWIPLTPEPELRDNRGARSLSVIARRDPGESLQSVEAELSVISGRLSELYPDTQQGWTTRVQNYDQLVRGHLRPMLLALLGALVLVFLIACANVTGLLLARVSSQRREFSIKVALGASPWRIVRQILIECVLLAVVGAGLGCLLALLILIFFQPYFAPYIREAGVVSINWRVGLFVLAQALVCGFLTAIIPASALVREVSQTGLREVTLSVVSGRRQGRFLKILAASQVALTFVLLLATGLMLRTLDQLQRAKTGFEPDNVLTAELWPSLQSVSGSSGSQPSGGGDVVGNVYLPLVDQLGSLPGVQAAGLISVLPLSGSFSGTRFYVVGRPRTGPADTPRCELRAISEGYFRALHIHLLAGRLPGVQDGAGSPPVAVINDVLAGRYFPNDDPIGRKLNFRPNGPEKESITIVGVFRATVQRGLSDPPEPELDLPYSQLTPDHILYPYLGAAQTNLVLRSVEPVERLVPSVRRVIYERAPELAIDNVRTMADHMRRTLSGQRLSSFLIAIFGGLALVMAAAGLHAVIALWVSQRTRELGLRMALGASRSNVLSLVGRQAGIIVAVGLTGGWALFLPMGGLVRSFLYGVAATDPITTAAVSLVIVFIGLLSVLRPAWRAVTIVPNEVLRAE